MQAAICVFHERFSTDATRAGRWRSRTASRPRRRESTPIPGNRQWAKGAATSSPPR
ncbi:hypothetical protein ACNKHQ_18695 [Shigella flexneri]